MTQASDDVEPVATVDRLPFELIRVLLELPVMTRRTMPYLIVMAFSA